MRIIGKPFITRGYNIVLTGKLVKDARISVVNRQNGGTIPLFKGALQIANVRGERAPAENLISVEMWGVGVDCLVEWPKGTVLTVFGEMVQDDYWTKQRGEKAYKVVAEKIDAQIDYRALDTLLRTQVEGKKLDARREEMGVEDASGYDPGF